MIGCFAGRFGVVDGKRTCPIYVAGNDGRGNGFVFGPSPLSIGGVRENDAHGAHHMRPSTLGSGRNLRVLREFVNRSMKSDIGFDQSVDLPLRHGCVSIR